MSFAPRPLSVPAYQRRKRFGSTFGVNKAAPNSSPRNPVASSPQVSPPQIFQPFIPPVVTPINRAKATKVTRINNRSTNPVNTYSAVNTVNSINNGINLPNKVADFPTRQRQVPPSSPPRKAQKQLWLEKPLKVPPVPKSSVKPVKPTFAPPSPWWLRSIFFFKYCSGFAVVGLMMAVLTTYGGIVSAQRQWTKEFQQLESLRQTERQLVAANEVIKNQVAKQSVGNQALVKVDPSSRVYIPAPDPVVLASVKPPTPAPNQSPKVIPLGY